MGEPLALDHLTDRGGDHGGAAVVRSGVDVVAISRIAALLDEFGASFRERAFAPEERAYCEARADPPQHYAARWAATEAFRKLCDDTVALPPLDAISVVHPGGEGGGAPALALAPPARAALDETCRRGGLDPSTASTSVSLSHDRTADAAVAQVVLAGSTRGGGGGCGGGGGRRDGGGGSG